MKIVGGSFGLKGSAFLSNNQLVVEGSRKAYFEAAQVVSVQTKVDASRGFGIFGAFIGVIVLGFLGLFLLGPFGAIAGIVVAIAGSFYTQKRNLAELAFADGSTLILECTPRAIDKLVRFR